MDDKDPDKYTKETLIQWKAAAESKAMQSVNTPVNIDTYSERNESSEDLDIETLCNDWEDEFREVEGTNFSKSLYGFLEMNKTVDEYHNLEDNKANICNFSNYINANIKCSECGMPMKLKKSSKGKFFLSCSGYPNCNNITYVTTDVVNNYLYSNDRSGKRCPHDNTSLEAKLGKYGVYVSCCGVNKHFYKLDEI